MSEEEIKLQTYKVLKQLGWKGGTYIEGDTVEMEPKFAEYYINEKVLEEADGENSTSEKTAKVAPARSGAAIAPLEPEPEQVIAAPSLTNETEE